jgi:hypothetical protein
MQSAPCIRRHGSHVYWFSLKIKVGGFFQFVHNTVLVVWPQNHPLVFPSLGLKISSYGLVIWPTKAPRRFLSLGLKTKWAMVCWLHHKTDGRMKTVWDMYRDLAACFTWKGVRLGFRSLASRLAEVRCRWCT